MESSVGYSGSVGYPTYQQSYSLAPSPLPQGYVPGVGYPGSYTYPQPYNPFSPPPPNKPPAVQSSTEKENPPIAPSVEPGITHAEAQHNQPLLDSKFDELHSGRRLQHFINLNASTARLQDEERELESVLSSSRWFSEGSLKKSHRTMTMDKERGHRTPHMQILQTRLISTLEEDGHETVTLTVDDEKTEKQQPVSNCNMRWMHIRSDNTEERADAITLTNFETAAMQTPGLDDKDRTVILHLFRSVRNKSEKTFIHGRYLDPVVTQWHAKSGNDDKVKDVEAKSKCATFFAIPYFSLEKYHSHESGGNLELHPVRTLLQTHYELEPTQGRDKHQILRKLGLIQDGIHVPQLWCLLVNNNHIITCAPADIKELFRDIIKIEEVSKIKESLKGSTVVRFSDPSGQIHFLPCDKCQTWFELLDRIGKQYQPIVNMMAEDKRSGWELLFEDGQPATDDNWAKRLAANNLITMNLELRWKSPLLLPPPPGPGGYKGPLSTTQTALSPFGVSHPGYGPYGVLPNSSFGGVTPNPFSYTPQSYTPGSYPQLGYPASYMAAPYPVPAPPSSVSDVSRPARTTQPKLLKSKEDELEELIEKTDKLKAKLSGQDLSEAQVKDIAYLAHLELELYKVEKSSLERAARALKEKAEREALEREVAERVEEVRQFRHQMLKELHPIEFTDCLSRYFKFPFVSCQGWPDIQTLIQEAFKHIEELKDFVDDGRYDLVVDDEIILPSCWEYLVEPRWNVRMLMWPIPKSAPRRPASPPGPPERPVSSSSEVFSSNSPGSTPSWVTGSVSVAKRDGWREKSSIYSIGSDWDGGMKSHNFPGIIPRRRRGRNWRSWRTRRFSNITRGRRRRDPSTDRSWTSASDSVHSQSGADEDGTSEAEGHASNVEENASDGGYSVEEASDHSHDGSSKVKSKEFYVQDVTNSNLEIIRTNTATNTVAGTSQDVDLALSPINQISQEREDGEAALQLILETREILAIEETPESTRTQEASLHSEDPQLLVMDNQWHTGDNFYFALTHVGEANVTGVELGLHERISPPIQIGDWIQNSQSDGSRTGGLELISIQNFWWERYNLFLQSMPTSTGSEPAHFREQGNIFEVHQVQNSVEAQAGPSDGSAINFFSGMPAQYKGHVSEESLGNLDLPESPTPVAGLHSVSDLETTAPTMRLRGGGLPDKVSRARVAYVEDVDEMSGRVILGRRTSASAKGKSVATTQNSDSDLSKSFIEDDDSSKYTVTIEDQSPQGSEVSGTPSFESWEGLSEAEVSSGESLAPSDSVSMIAKKPNPVLDTEDLYEAGPSNTASRSGPPPKLKGILSSTKRKKKKGKRERARFEDANSDNSNGESGALNRPSARPPRSSRPRASTSQNYPFPTPVPSSYSAPASSYYQQGPGSMYTPSNPFSPYPSYGPPSTYISQPPFSVAPSSFSPDYGGYPVPSPFAPMVPDLDDMTTDPTKIYYTPSSSIEVKKPVSMDNLFAGKEEAPASQGTETPQEDAEKGGEKTSMTQKLADRLSADKLKIKSSLTEKVERLASRRSSKPLENVTISPPTPPDTPKPKVPEIFRWPVGEDGVLDDEKIPGSPGRQTVSSFRSNANSSKGDMMFTVLKDAHVQLNRYLERYPRDLDVFNSTEKSSEEDVYELMKEVATRVHGAKDVIADWELLLDTARQLLHSFTPPGVEEHLVGVFWGSLANILRSAETNPNRDMTPMYSRAQRYLTIIEEILNGVSVSSLQAKPRYRIPDALVPAFEHLVMVFCIFGCNTPLLQEAEMRHHRRCEDLLMKGKKQLILIHAGDLSEANMYRAVDSEGLAALMFKQIVHISSRGDKKPNILVAYQNYMAKLELQVLEEPTVRVFDDIQDLVQELSIIETVLRQQRTVLEGGLTLFSTTAKSKDAFALITLAKGLQDIRKQISNVTELLHLAQNKKNLLSQAISIRKETNNQAILVFTIVTVVFLPLSFITSYLGMNSIDIRNAAFTQLRFWELAIPLTVIVLLAVWGLLKFKRRLSRGIRSIIRRCIRR